MHKRGLKFALAFRVSEAKIYLCHSSRIAKARAGPWSDDWLDHPSVQTISSSPWLIKILNSKEVILLKHFH